MRNLLLFVFLYCSVIQAQENDYHICTEKFSEVVSKNNDLENTLNEWNKCKEYCHSDGAFEQYVSYIYGRYNKYNDGLQYLLAEEQKHNVVPKRIIFTIAEAYYVLGYKQKYLEYAIRTINQYPEWQGGYRLMGIFYEDKGDLKKAEYFFMEAITQKKEGYNLRNLMSLVEVYTKCDEYNKAVQMFLRADSLGGNLALSFENATCYGAIALIKTGSISEAKKVLITQAQYDPSAVNLNAYKEAVRLYEEASGELLS